MTTFLLNAERLRKSRSLSFCHSSHFFPSKLLAIGIFQLPAQGGRSGEYPEVDDVAQVLRGRCVGSFFHEEIGKEKATGERKRSVRSYLGNL